MIVGEEEELQKHAEMDATLFASRIATLAAELHRRRLLNAAPAWTLATQLVRVKKERGRGIAWPLAIATAVAQLPQQPVARVPPQERQKSSNREMNGSRFSANVEVVEEGVVASGLCPNSISTCCTARLV